MDRIEVEALLFQTGYVTIERVETLFDHEKLYCLGYPNHEVKKSLTDSILYWYSQGHAWKKRNQLALVEALKANDMERLKGIFHAFFASIPHDWYRRNQLARYEGYYASVVYCYFAALGLDVRAEETTNHGQMDLVVHFQNRVYIIEFKVAELAPAGSALQQIKDKGYAERYAGRPVFLVGGEFRSETRNIVQFEWEAVG